MHRSIASLAIVILILISTIACLPRSSQPPEITGFNPDALAGQVMQDFNLPGMALVVVQGDKVTYLKGYGEVYSGGPVFTSSTPLTIGSLSKSFTALATMQLVEQGRIKLDETVVTYLPWFHTSEKAMSDRITIQHLLNQTSGLSSGIGLEPVYDHQPDYTLEQRLNNLSKYKQVRPAGEEFEYSNTNYMLLGAVIEVGQWINLCRIHER